MAYSTFQTAVLDRGGEDRATFIRRTYLHLAMAVLLFVGIEAFLFTTSLPMLMLQFMAGSKFGWLMILGGFMVLGWLARGFAQAVESPALQYFGLVAFVVGHAIIFLPILTFAQLVTAPNLISTAAIMTLLLFTGLTLTAFITRKDFSFLRGVMVIGGMLALGLIVCGVIFGFNLGLWFSVAMVALAAIGILHDTSKVMLHYPTDQHVAASLELFASVALMFWYILRILMALRGRD